MNQVRLKIYLKSKTLSLSSETDSNYVYNPGNAIQDPRSANAQNQIEV